jgi:hypothetical protein
MKILTYTLLDANIYFSVGIFKKSLNVHAYISVSIQTKGEFVMIYAQPGQPGSLITFFCEYKLLPIHT